MSDQVVYNKWLSRRWLVCVWAMMVATGLIVYGSYRQITLPWYGSIINLLQLIIAGYIAADSFTKPKGV